MKKSRYSFLCTPSLWVSLSLFFPFSSAVAEVAPVDTARVVDIEEVVVIATPKETGKLRSLPSAASLVSQREMHTLGIHSAKGLSVAVPNLFIPDYGSRLTSAIYIRGIGSRINTPAVGLYVDNFPYYDKSTFDFNLYEIERIDVLRGPQGTLYGRNSMGGLIRVNTRSPFTYQGTDLRLGLATGDWHRRASLTHYHRISDRFAFSAGGYYDGSSGFWHNDTRHERQDKMNSGGGKLRAILKPSDRLTFDGTIAYDYTHEGGYPYFYLGATSDAAAELYPDNIGRITSNEKSSYRRGMLNSGLNVEWKTDKLTFNSITSFQRMQDRMFMDQDFLSDSIYTLEQRQRLSLLNEEVTVKANLTSRWSMVSGLTLSKQWLTTNSPVVFKQGGTEMLENTINSYLDRVHQNTGAPQMAAIFNSETLPINSYFKSPVFNVALFHLSTVNITDRWSASLGARLDYEHNSLTYLSEGNLNYDFSVMGRVMPQFRGLEVNPRYEGKLKDDHVEVLPKGTVKYAWTDNNFVYLSAAKGHRPGGYNIQMFSDILQSSMQTEMMNQVGGSRGGAHTDDTTPDIKGTVTYKPEFSWTYELGTKQTHLDGSLTLEGALFLTTVRDQQIARFSDNGLGRMMVNAGRSRNWGLEASVRYNPTERLTTWADYGFTRATFTKYDDGNNNYTGNYVPFIPRNTLSLGADYKFSILNSQCSMVLGVNALGAGRIYWTEANNASQPMYFTFGTHALFDFGNWEVNIWGRNLTDKHYHTFYFESMSRAYAQKGKPLQVGVDVNLRF